jgi:protein gp37
MGYHTNIEWTDSSWPVVTGCSRVSEGCTRCYAERLTATRLRNVPAYKDLAVLNSNGEARWTGEVRLNEKVLEDPLHWRKPRRIFVSQMSDLFHEKCRGEWIADIFGVMARCPQHIFQVLTKRPENMKEFLADLLGVIRSIKPNAAPFLPNVWLGVSVEDQKTADERIPILLQTPAAVRWVSYEPALGPVDFIPYLDPSCAAFNRLENARVDWVVCGGESGPGARPMHPDWARVVRDQCAVAGVTFFMKQMCERGRKIPFEKFPKDLQIREYPASS